MRSSTSLTFAAGGALAAAVLLAGCRGPATPSATAPANNAPRAAVQFVDAASTAGVNFQHNSGAFGQYWMPESMGSGCAFLDYNGDGRLDIFLVNSTDWVGHGDEQTSCALYENIGDGKFRDVTAAAGLASPLYGMGVAVGDFDNDGDPDLYITALGANRLYQNDGTGKFHDIAPAAGVADDRWSTSATWIDYDRDGRLDLFVCNYVLWTPQNNLPCNILEHLTYCPPGQYQGVNSRLYRNAGGGKFTDVSEAAGVSIAQKALGVVACDFNDDGWPDLAVACDTQPNRLFENMRTGTFRDVASTATLAYGPTGEARAGMGIDSGDFSGRGSDGFVVGNFAHEMLGLYRNDTSGENAYFQDVAQNGSVGRDSLLFLSFGVFFWDYDNDGWLDVMVATGHLQPQVQLTDQAVTFEQRPLLFHNQGGGSFEEVGRDSGAAMLQAAVHRGSAFGDYDGDGDLDALLTTSNGPARLLRNDGGSRNQAVRLILEGTNSNRDAFGTRLIAQAGGQTLRRLSRASRGYLSQSEPAISLGVGSASQVDSLAVRWPNGAEQTFQNLPAGKTIRLREGEADFAILGE